MADQVRMEDARIALPEGWKSRRDLICVAGEPCAGFFEAAADQGIERVIVFVPEGAPTPEVPATAIIVRTQVELMNAVQRLPGGLPHHIQLKRWDRDNVSDELLADIQRTLTESLAAKKLGLDTIDVWGKLWAGRVLENLFHLASVPSVANLEGAFAGVPCFLVAPGPSLEKNIHELRRVRGRGIVLSTSHALRPLQEAGVRADLVIAADPGKLLTRHFHGVDTAQVGALVLGATNEAGQYELPGTRVFSFESNEQIDNWLFGGFGEVAHLATGGSVACSALSLALRMGCDPITFVGQDLAFSGDRYYTGSTYDGDSKICLAEDGKSFVLERDLGTARQADESAVIHTQPTAVFEVPGHDGETVRTSLHLKQFLQWIQTVVKTAASCVTIYNCTEGGAHIEGADHVPLARVIESLPENGFDADAVLEAAGAGIDVPQRRAEMSERIDEMLSALRGCMTTAKSCVKLIDRSERDPGALKKLDREEKKLARSLEPLLLFSLIAQKRIRDAEASGADASEPAEIRAAARQLYEVVLESGRELGPILRESREQFVDTVPRT